MTSRGHLQDCLAQAPLPSLITANEAQPFAQHTPSFWPQLISLRMGT